MTDKAGPIKQRLSGRIPAGEVRVEMGGIVCSFLFTRPEDYRSSRMIYDAFLTERPADIEVWLETVEHIDPENLDTIMDGTTFTHADNRFWTSSQVASGNYDLSNAIISMVVERELGELTHHSNYRNTLMTLVYHSACRVKYGDGPVPSLLVNGCTVLCQDKGFIFTGMTREIRNTIVNLFPTGTVTVLNDANILVSRGDQGKEISLENPPLINSVPLQRSGTIPAGAVFFLTQGERSAVRKLDPAEAYVKLVRQVDNPAYIGQTSKREIYQVIADFSGNIVEHLPMYEIAVSADAGDGRDIIQGIENIVLEKEMVI